MPIAAALPHAPAASATPVEASCAAEASAATAPASGLPRPVAFTEIEAFDPRLLGGLPAPCTLRCVAGAQRVIITTSAAEYERQRTAGGAAIFTGRELAALALAAEHERGSPHAMQLWCERKLREPTWSLRALEAIGGAVGRFEPRGWRIGRVFARLGLVLEAVEVEDGGADAA